MTTRHIPALDGLRGVAVLLVMMFHFLPRYPQSNALMEWGVKGLRAGWGGVNLFFVLSGFLITGILLDTKGAPGYLRSFIARRALRIFPLYYATLLLVCTVLPFLIPAYAGDAASVLGRQGYLWGYATNLYNAANGAWKFDVPNVLYLGHFWSLAIEEQFYLFWPFIVLATTRKGLTRMCVGLIALAWTLRTALALSDWEGAGIAAYVFTLCRTDALALGGLVAITLRERGALDHLRPLAVAMASVCATIMVAILYWRKAFYFADPAVFTVGYAAVDLLCASVLILAITSAGALGKALSARVLRFFGTYSYALYIFHPILEPIYKHLVPASSVAAVLGEGITSMLVVTALYVAFTIPAALLSWHLLEKHALRLKERIAPRVKPSGVVIGVGGAA